MKQQFLPYYISRAVLSAAIAIFMVGFNWMAILAALVFFGFFLIYLHIGWFEVKTDNPLFPLRRDSRGQLIQRKALIIAIVLGILTHFSFSLLSNNFGLESVSGNVSIAFSIITYFTTQFILMAKI